MIENLNTGRVQLKQGGAVPQVTHSQAFSVTLLVSRGRGLDEDNLIPSDTISLDRTDITLDHLKELLSAH